MPTSKNIFDVLDKIRKSPVLYFPHRSLEEVHQWCHGYYCALGIHELKEPGPSLSSHRFGEWLRLRFGWSWQYGWARAIRDHCNSNEEAFNRFFELIDEYRILREYQVAKVQLGPQHLPQYPSYRVSTLRPAPFKLEVLHYEPENLYFLIAHRADDGHGGGSENASHSLNIMLAFAERLYQVKPSEWEIIANPTRQPETPTTPPTSDAPPSLT